MNNYDIYKTNSFFEYYISNSSNLNKSNPIGHDDLAYFNSLKFINGDMPKDMFVSVEKIISQLNNLLFQMVPLFELGIKFNIYLAGGAIRDLLLNNHNKIKDLDVIFDFSLWSDYNKKTLSKLTLKTINKIIEGNINVSQTEWDTMDIKQKQFFLIFEISKKHYQIDKQLTLKELKEKSSLANETYEHMLNKELEAVITVSSTELTYPMDLLIINTNIKDYIETFSFEICKIYAPILDLDCPKLITDTLALMHSIKSHKGFIKDAKAKSMTLKMYKHQEPGKVIKILDKHFFRIQKKYPEYKLILDDGNIEDMKKLKDSYLSKQNLESILEKKDIVISSASIKI